MEGRIEYGNLRYTGHNRFAGFDTDNVGRIVERRHSGATFERLHNFCRNERGRSELFTAVYDAVPHGVNSVHRLDNAAVLIRKNIEYQLDGNLMIRNGLHDFLLLSVPLMGQLRIGQGNLFHKALRHDFFIFHVYQLVL